MIRTRPRICSIAKRSWIGCRVGVALLVGLLAAAITAAPAPAATTRYAAPTPTGAANCSTPANACGIQTAVEAVSVVDGDEVVLASGDYTVAGDEVTVGDAIDLHGAAGQPRPRLISSSSFALRVDDPGALIRDLMIDHSGSGAGLIHFGGGTAERVAVSSSAGGGACALSGNALLRDATCRNTATGPGVSATLSGAETWVLTLRNVTAYAPGAGGRGIQVAADSGADITMDAKNTIASGGFTDVWANNTATGTRAEIELDHSNYDSETVLGTATITAHGTGTNQVDPPLLADPGTGDFHQLTGSPTINAGATDASIGAGDIDGEARVQGAAIDIGADEFTVAAPPQPVQLTSDTAPPGTEIRKGPKKTLRTSKEKVKVTFRFGSDDPGASFECKLDKRPFAPCTSPFTARVRTGPHKFQVRAIDGAGNADATPDVYAWKVKDLP